MEHADIVLPSLIVRRLELTPHDCCEDPPQYCRQYAVRFYNTDTHLLQLKHDQQFDQVMDVYQQYMSLQQEMLQQTLINEKEKKCTKKCKEKTLSKMCSCHIGCNLDDIEEELEQEIAIIYPTYDEPVLTILNDLINYVVNICEDKQGHGDDGQNREDSVVDTCEEMETIVFENKTSFQKLIRFLCCRRRND